MSAWEPSLGASDEWYTPKYIFDALDVRFDFDVAAPQEGPRHVPTSRWFSAGSLDQHWYGFIWMNPPFGGRNGLDPWLTKFIDHGNGIALVPDRTSAPWFQAAANRMDSILFLSPKVKFERPDGSIGKSPGTGTALMAIGERGASALTSGRRLGILMATVACLAATPAAAYWDCYPVRAIRSGPMLHHTHFIAHHARTTTHPTIRHHKHHHRSCHVHLHCVWIDDGGPAGDGAGGGYSAEGYGFGSSGEGDAGGFGGFGGGEGGGLPYSPVVPIQPVNIDIPCYFPPPCIPPLEYPPVTPPIAQVPETSTWVMLALGFAFLFGVGRKHASKQRVI